MDLSTVQKKSPRESSTELGKPLSYCEAIAVQLGRLAIVLGQTLDPRRQALMAQDLSDLPLDALEHALTAWRRGETGHLSEYQREHSRVGIFFPTEAEIRAIARPYLSRKRNEEDLLRRKEEEQERMRYMKEHPEEFICTPDQQAKWDEFNAKYGFKVKTNSGVETRPN